MDLLLILRDALASSLAGTLLVAIEGVKTGRTVGVLFTEEALAALLNGTFSWPRELSGQEIRWTMADQGASHGLPVSARGQGRQLDVKGLIHQAHEAGVLLYACLLWDSLVSRDSNLPDHIQGVDTSSVVKLLSEAKTVVGSL
jgi:hypothetical protein